MKVLLVKPHNLADHIQASMGLGILAQLIRDRHEVEIYDCIKEGIEPNRFAECVLKNGREDVDIVCIQCYTFDIKNVKDIMRSIRSYNSNIKIMVGGAHISGSPKPAINDFGDLVDYALAGEGELGFPKFIDALETNNFSEFHHCPGLMWRDETDTLHSVPPQLVPEERLDELGIVAWDLIQPQTYPEAQFGAFYKQFPVAAIVTTRGCPYKCTFCNAPQMSGRNLRHHSPEFVIEEIKTLVHDYGIREIHIVDDNFTMDLPYAKTVLRKIIEADLNIALAMPNGVRMDWLDDEILTLMKQAGMYMVTVAIESGNDRILKLMKKGTTVKRIRKCIDKIRQHNLDIAAFFILGFPTETLEEMEASVHFALELDIQRANFFTYLPLPGTESYEMLLNNGELQDVDWDNFYVMAASYVPKNITRKQLLNKKRSAFLRFYFRPRAFFYTLSKINSFRHFSYIFQRFFRWIVMDHSKQVVPVQEIPGSKNN